MNNDRRPHRDRWAIAILGSVLLAVGALLSLREGDGGIPHAEALCIALGLTLIGTAFVAGDRVIRRLGGLIRGPWR